MNMYLKLGPQTIEQYDFRTRTWKPDGHLNTRRWQFACVILNKKLYVCGGRDGLKTLEYIQWPPKLSGHLTKTYVHFIFPR